MDSFIASLELVDRCRCVRNTLGRLHSMINNRNVAVHWTQMHLNIVSCAALVCIWPQTDRHRERERERALSCGWFIVCDRGTLVDSTRLLERGRCK